MFADDVGYWIRVCGRRVAVEGKEQEQDENQGTGSYEVPAA